MRISIVAIVLCVGCGGGVSIDEFPDALVDALCTRYVRCGVVEDHDSCRALLNGFENLADIQHAVANHSVRYDEDKMQDCVDAFAATSCDQSSESARVDPPACLAALRGTVADGGTCMISAQCVSGSCDNASCPMACCEGTCAPTVADVPVGMSCLTGPCVAGSFCNATQICQPLLAAGQTCASNGQCGYGLYCPTASRVCTTSQHRGDPCLDRSCADLGTRCDATQVCAGYPRRNEGCSAMVPCQAPNVCSAQTAICVAPPSLGQQCTVQCAPGSFCDGQSHLCTAPKADGQPCVFSDECTSANCDDSTAMCAPQPVCI